MQKNFFYLFLCCFTITIDSTLALAQAKIEADKATSYAFGQVVKNYFRTRKSPETPNEWNHLMRTVVDSMRKVGQKYGNDIQALQSITDHGFPKWLARIISGISKKNVKNYKTILSFNNTVFRAEWYLPHSVLSKNTSKETFEELLSQEKPEVILYLHGGAMCLCSHKTHRELLFRLAASTGKIVLAIDYRKPPAHPFPAPQEDCFAAYQWLISKGLSVIIAGDSAGGTLALMTTKLALENNITLPEKLLLISPWVDLEENSNNCGRSSSLILNSRIDYLPPNVISLFAQSCLANVEDMNEKQISSKLATFSPTNFNLENFPEMLVLCGSREMLIDQQKIFVAKAQKETLCKFIEEPGMVHVYPLFAALGVANAQKAYQDIAKFLTK